MKKLFYGFSFALSTFYCITTSAATKEAPCVDSEVTVDEAIPGWKTISPNVGVNVLVQMGVALSEPLKKKQNSLT